MPGRYIKLLFLIVIFLSAPVFAQQEEVETSNKEFNPSLDSKDYDDYGVHLLINKGQMPTIEVIYGMPEASLKGLSGELGNRGSAEIRAGYTTIREFHKNLHKLNQNFIFFSGAAKGLYPEGSGSGKTIPQVWRAGLGKFYGYGYKIHEVSITPYTSNLIAWSHISFGNLKDNMNPQDAERLELYDRSVRFGTASEGGIKLKFGQNFTFTGGYEKSVVFPRYIFWEHMGSIMLEYCGLAAIDHFVKKVIVSSPLAGPITDFVLKNAFSYAIYQLRKDEQDWPFNGSSPLSFDTWKIGMTFIL
ncbi:MAG: hypothetical protein ACM34K_06235 [Bacillota bacterium]